MLCPIRSMGKPRRDFYRWNAQLAVGLLAVMLGSGPPARADPPERGHGSAAADLQAIEPSGLELNGDLGPGEDLNEPGPGEDLKKFGPGEGLEEKAPGPAFLAPAPLLSPVPLSQEPELDPAGTAPEQPWAYTLELYGFLPISTIGSTTIRGLEADFDVTLPEILEVLRFAASARGSIEYGRLGLLADLYYVNVGDQAAKVVGARELFNVDGEVGFIEGIYDLAFRYRFGDREAATGEPGSYTIIPYAGMRILNGDLDIVTSIGGPLGLFQPSVRRTFQRTWVQPLIGTQASVFLSPRLKAFLRGDVGGFGLAGEQDLSANAQLGLAYAIGNNTSINLSWRYLAIEFNNGASPSNGFTSYQNGIEAGLKFFF